MRHRGRMHRHKKFSCHSCYLLFDFLKSPLSGKGRSCVRRQLQAATLLSPDLEGRDIPHLYMKYISAFPSEGISRFFIDFFLVREFLDNHSTFSLVRNGNFYRLFPRFSFQLLRRQSKNHHALSTFCEPFSLLLRDIQTTHSLLPVHPYCRHRKQFLCCLFYPFSLG